MAKRWLILAAYAACAAALGCQGEDADESGSGGAATGGAGGTSSGGAAGQGGAGTIETRGATVSVACVESSSTITGCAQPYSASIAAITLNACNYWASTGNLTISFLAQTAQGRIDVTIPSFSGDGTYTAADPAHIAMVDDGLASAATTDAAHQCTIQVTSNFAQVVVPATGEAQLLDVALAFNCPGLAAGSICDANCTVSPAAFTLSVKGCVVSQ